MLQFYMINLKLVPKDMLYKSVKDRGIDINIDDLYILYEKNKKNRLYLDQLLHKQKNYHHTSIEATNIKSQIKDLKKKMDVSHNTLNQQLSMVPNILHITVPYGQSENDNITIEQYKELIFNKAHYEFDLFYECVSHTGSRFYILKDQFALLYRAIINFCMDTLKKHGFQEYIIPTILRDKALYRTGHLPNLSQDMFHVEDNQFLIPTGECVLVNMCYQKSYKPEDLPLKKCTVSPCYRKESGASGKDQKGLIRLHQFYKCEMVCFTEADQSYQMLEEMLSITTNMLKKLLIPYQVEILCSGDIGFCASKTYDIKIPICNQWREVASISNTEDFQTSNMNTRIKDRDKKRNLHALNGSALPIERTLASLLEVHYDHKSNIINIPISLQKYLDFTCIYV